MFALSHKKNDDSQLCEREKEKEGGGILKIESDNDEGGPSGKHCFARIGFTTRQNVPPVSHAACMGASCSPIHLNNARRTWGIPRLLIAMWEISKELGH